ncbi:hypothetical protein GGR70_003408 [Xanthomonas campestris]|uniref:hypothetical protein n=1 Tax=Xanthomonas campestris TaxID=339 RepID=UPI0021691912|nr:hypothetical protein [Xanthomonas campestris]MCS3848361.1 hypothetical protein [Xanthomonas campestris]
MLTHPDNTAQQHRPAGSCHSCVVSVFRLAAGCRGRNPALFAPSGVIRARCSWLIAVPLLLVAASVCASSTMCTFRPSSDASRYELEFLGYGEIQQVLFRWPGSTSPSGLPAGSYKVLSFDERRASIDLVYRSPGDPDLTSSFTLKGTGKQVHLRTADAAISGELDCAH